MTVLTVNALNTLHPRKWVTESLGRGCGSLRTYGRRDGANFYFRYIGPDGKEDDLPLGQFDQRGIKGMTLAEARQRAGYLSRRYQAGDRALRAVLDAEKRAATRKLEEEAQAAQDAVEHEQASLGALLLAYCEWLDSKHKASAKDVRASLHLHVKKAWPKLWDRAADDVTPDDLMDVLMRITAAGKLRMAGVIRSYIRAAYATGIAARTKASATPALRALRIRTNPARDFGTIEGGSARAGQRALSREELRVYWKRISIAP